MWELDKSVIYLAIPKGTLPWQTIKRKMGVFFLEKFSSSRFYSETEWNIVTSMDSWEAYWMWLHHVQIQWCLVPQLQKWAYPANNLRTCLTNLDQLFSFNRHMGGIINLMFILRSLKGRRYGNQLIWDTFCKWQIWPLPVFVLVIWNKMK